MSEPKLKECPNCRAFIVGYSDGFITKDFTKFCGDSSLLPEIPDEREFWVFKDCKKNQKKLQFLNLVGDCKGYEKK